VFFSLLYLGLRQLCGLVRSSRRSPSEKDVELMVLRHQVRILERQLHGRLRYRPADREILAALTARALLALMVTQNPLNPHSRSLVELLHAGGDELLRDDSTRGSCLVGPHGHSEPPQLS
jgi:hypothetical protein